jgi:choline kinase
MVNSLSVAILASIPGYRMQTRPCVSILPITDSYNLIDLQYHSIRNAYKTCDIVMTIGHNAGNVIEKRPKEIRIIENSLYQTTGEVQELRLVANNISSNSLLIINGDTIFNTNFIKSIDLNQSTLFIDKVANEEEPGCFIVKERVTSVGYGNKNSLTGIIYLTGLELELLQRYVNVRSKSNYSQVEAYDYIASRGNIKSQLITSEYISKYKLRKKNDDSDRK